MTISDFDAIDYFRETSIYQDPYPYYEYLREHGPVWREPHHGVVMVTGYAEAMEVYTDTATFSNCNTVSGPFAKWPVPLDGDDISGIIEQYRENLPFSDQLPSFDPPRHTAHRALLMRLLTPKRLGENEEFMWRLADRQIDGFVARGEREFVRDYASPFTLLVIANLLGVPEADHAMFMEELQGDNRPTRQRGAMSHKPLEFLYERFTAYIEECRSNPRDDVMTKLATQSFPDGSLPEVRDIMLIAANLFAAGQETTARLSGPCSDSSANAGISNRSFAGIDPISHDWPKRAFGWRVPSRGNFDCHVSRPQSAALTFRRGRACSCSRARLIEIEVSSSPRPNSVSTGRMAVSTSGSGSASIPAPGLPLRGWRLA